MVLLALRGLVCGTATGSHIEVGASLVVLVYSTSKAEVTPAARRQPAATDTVRSKYQGRTERVMP
jgi:hypothetical protein